MGKMGEHYEEAERYVHRGLDGDNLDDWHRKNLLMAAQVHASLAVAEQLEGIFNLLNNSMAMA